MAPLIPVTGASVGIVVNNSLVKKWGRAAINVYGTRLFDNENIILLH